MTPGDLTYRNQAVRISDLAVTSDVIEGVTFEGCQIIGPAVVALMQTDMVGCSFEGDEVGLLWPLGGRDHVIGAIGLANCIIRSCTFQRIGLAVPDDQLPEIRAGLGL